MGFGKCHLFFRCARMKFFPLLLYLLLLLDSFQGSILSHKRSIRAVNTTLHTDFNGTYERRNPCTNAKIETTSYIASHEFRHYTKEDKWSDYTNKCTAIISSFLRALGNLVRFSNNQNAVFNFHINTSISQKQDAIEPGIGNSSCYLPTITIEATDCEIYPRSSCQNAPVELKGSKGKIPDERKYTFSGHSSNAKFKTINQASKGVPAADQLQYQSDCQILNEPPKTYVSIKPQENHVTGHSQIRSIIKLEPPSKSVNKNQTGLVNQRFVAEDELQTEENWTLTDTTVTPGFSGSSTVAEAEDYFQTPLNDYPEYMKFTLEPELNINLIETSTKPEYSCDPSNSNLKAVTVRPENEFMTASVDEIDQTQNEPLLPNTFNSPPPNSSKSPLTYLQKSDTTASLDTTESDRYGALTTRNHQYYSPQTPMLRTESTSQRTQSMNDDDILIRNQDESYGNDKELSFVHSKQPLIDYMNKQVPDSQFNESVLNQQPVNSFFSSDQILGPQLPFLPSVHTTDKTFDNKNLSTISPKHSLSLSDEEIIANRFLEGVQPAESLSYRVPYSKSNSLKRPPAETYFLKNPARNANPLLQQFPGLKQNQKYNTTSFETFTADQQSKNEKESRNSYINSLESQTQILPVTTNLKTEPDKFSYYPNQLETYTLEPYQIFTSDLKKPLEVENTFPNEQRYSDKKSNIPMSKFPTSTTPLISTQILDFPRDIFIKYDNEEITTSTAPGVDDSDHLSETELSLNNNFAGITPEPQISNGSGFYSSPETEISFSDTISTPRVRNQDEINEPLTELFKEETDDDVNYERFLSSTLPKSQRDNFYTTNKLPLSVSEPHSYYSKRNFDEDFNSQSENVDEELRLVSQPSLSSVSSDFNKIAKAPRNNDQVLTKYPTTMTPEIQSDQLSVSSDLSFPEPELFLEKSESLPVRNFETTEAFSTSSTTDGKTEISLFNQKSSSTIPALQNESKLTASVPSRQYLSSVSFDNQNYTTSSFIEASSPNLEYVPLQTANLKNSPPYIHNQVTTPSYKQMASNFDEFPPQTETTSFVSTTPTPFFDTILPISYKNPEEKPALQLDLTSDVRGNSFSAEYFTTLPPDLESFDYPSIVPYQGQTTSQALPSLAGKEISLPHNDRILNQETTSVPSISDLYSEQATPVNISPREQGLSGIDTTKFSNFDDYQDPLYQEADSSPEISRQFFNEENAFTTKQPYFNSKTVSNSETTSPEQLNTETSSEYDTSVSDTLVMSKKKQPPFIMNKNPDVTLNQPLPDSISSLVSNRRTTELPGLPSRQFLDISKTIPSEFYKNNNYATTPLESAYTTTPNSKENQVPSEDTLIYNQFAQTSAVVHPNIDEEYSSPNQMSNKRPIENFGTTFFPKEVTSDSFQEQVLPSYTKPISKSERFPVALPQTTFQPENFSLSSNQKPSNLLNFSTQRQYEESESKYGNLDSLEQSEKPITALPASVVDVIETQSDSPNARNFFARKTTTFTASEPYTEGPTQTTAFNPQISYSNEPLPPQTTTDLFDSEPSYSNESYTETPVTKFINPVLNPQSSYSDELYSKQPSSKVKSSTGSFASFTFSENESKPYFIPDTNFASKRQPQGPENQYNGLQFSPFRDRNTTFFRPPLTPWNKYQTLPTSELPLNLEPQTVPLSSVNRSSDTPMPEARTVSEYDKEMTPIERQPIQIPAPKPEESDFSSQTFSSSTNNFFPNFVQQSTESFNQQADGQESTLKYTEPFSNISPKKSSSSTPVFTNPPSVQTPSHSFELQTQPQLSYSQIRSNSDNLESESLISRISDDQPRLVTLQPSFVTRSQQELNLLQPINRSKNFKLPGVPEQTPFDLSNTQDAKPDQYQTLESLTPSHTSQYQLEDIAPFIGSSVEVTLREKPESTDSSIRNIVTSPANSEPQFDTNLAHSFDKLAIENSDQESASAYHIPLSRLPLDSPNNDNRYVSTIFPPQTNINLDDAVTIPDHPSSAEHIFQPQLSTFDSKTDKASVNEQILVPPTEDQTQAEYFPTTLRLFSEIPNGNMTAQTEILDDPDTTIPDEAFTPIPPFYSDVDKQYETDNKSKSRYVQEKIPFHSTSLSPEPQHSSVHLPDISVKNTEPATLKRFYSTSPFELRPEELSQNGSPAANNLQTQHRKPYIKSFAQSTPNTNSHSDIQLRNQDLNYFDELSNLKTSTLTYPTPDRQLPFVTDVSPFEYITGDSVPDSQLTPNSTFLFLNQTPRFIPSDSLIFSDIKPKELLNKSNEPSQQNTAVPIRGPSAKQKMNDFQTVISADNVLPQLEPRSAAIYDEEIITKHQTSHSPKPQPQTSLKNVEKISESTIEESVTLDANNSPYKQDLFTTTPFEFQPTPSESQSSLNFDNFGKDVNYKPLFLPPSLTETGNTVQQLDTMSTSSPDQIRENYDSNLYSQTPSSFPLKYQTQNMKSIEQKFTETNPLPLTPQSEHEREFSIQTDKLVSTYQPPYHSFSRKYQLSEKQMSEANPALHGRFASIDSTQKPLEYFNNETPTTPRAPPSETHVLPSGFQTTSNQKDNSFAPYNDPLPMLPSDRQILNMKVFPDAQSVPPTFASQFPPNLYFNQFKNYNSEIPSNGQFKNFNSNEFNPKNYPNSYQAFSNYQTAESRVPSESPFNYDQNLSNKRFSTDSTPNSPAFYEPQSRLHTQFFPAYTHTNVRELSSDSLSSPTTYRQQTRTPSHTQPQLTEPNSGVDTKRLESNSKPFIRYEQPNNFFVPRNWDVTNFNSSSSESSDPYQQSKRPLSPSIRNDAMSLAPYPDTIPREPRPFERPFLPFERKAEYVNSQSRFPSYFEAASYEPWSDSFGIVPVSHDRQTGPFINYGPSQTRPMFYPPYTDTNYRQFQSHSLPNSLSDGQQTGSFRTLPQTQSQYIAPYSGARRKAFESDSYLSTEAEPVRKSFPNQMPPFSFKKVESDSPERFYFNYEQQQQQPLPFNNSYSAQPPSFASNRDPSRIKTTKIVEEIITTTLPPNMTNSAEQLAFADKLLNNKKYLTEELRPPVGNDSPLHLFNNKNYENNRDEISGPPFIYNYKQLPNNHLPSKSQYIANNNAQQAERFSDRHFQIDEDESRNLNKNRPILENVTPSKYPPNNQILSTQSFNEKLLENNVRNPKKVMNVPTDRQVFDRQSTTITKEQDRSYNYQAGPPNQPQIDSSSGFNTKVITNDNRARATQEPQIFSPSSKTPTFSSPPAPTEQYLNPLFQTLETHLNLPLNEPSKLQEQPFPEPVSFGPKRASSFPPLNSSLLLETQNQNENFVNSYRSQPNDGDYTARDVTNTSQLDSHALVSDLTAPSKKPGEDYVSCCGPYSRGSIPTPLLCPFDRILKGNMTAPSYYILVSKLPVDDDEEERFQVEKVYLGDGTPLNCTLSTGKTFPTLLYTPIPFSAAGTVKLLTKSDSA